MDKRKLKLENYGISDKRYKELSGFCEQYPDWIKELKFRKDTLASRRVTDIPTVRQVNSDQTSELAVRRVTLQRKCEMVEQTAVQANAELYPYIIKSVCYEMPFTYLQAKEEMPCSRAAFYDARRYFFYLLDKNKE